MKQNPNVKEKPRGFFQTNACAEGFLCRSCGRQVIPEGAGSKHRNHCPHCLASVHLDVQPGDRQADCGGVMEPIAVWVRKGGEWAVIHRCKRCGALSSNRVAADDHPLKLLSLAMKPLCEPPFPLEYLRELAEQMEHPSTPR